MWNKLSDYFLDISKYIITGVVLAAFFSNLESKWLLYLLGIVSAAVMLGLGIYFSKLHKKIEEKDE